MPSLAARQAYDRQRNVRAREVRAQTIELDQSDRATAARRVRAFDARHPLPATRNDCVDQPRPCPYVRCRHHLYTDVSPIGGLKLNFPDLEVWELTETCALDVAERGGATLEEVGALLNITRERTRQIEEAIGEKVKARAAAGAHAPRVLLAMAEELGHG